MAKYNILFGFKESDIETQIVNIVRKSAEDVVYTERESRESIKEYIEKHRECTTAIIREGMGHESFTAEDFAELTDYRDLNVIAIIDDTHKGKNFMHVLYAAGITSAIFVSPKKGASPSYIAHLVIEPRCRKDARNYYKIKGSKINLNVLDYETYVYYYTRLLDSNKGLNIIDRYLSIVSDLTPRQTADFTNRLPLHVKKQLCSYKEFYPVVESLRKQGVTVRIPKVDGIRKGLTDEQFAKALRSEKRYSVKRAADPSTTTTTKNSQGKTTAIAEESNDETESEGNVFFAEAFGEETEPVKGQTKPQPQRVEQSRPVAKPAPQPEPKKKEKKRKEKKPKKEKTKLQWKVILIVLALGLLLLLTYYCIGQMYLW